jgi:hypothetical protein
LVLFSQIPCQSYIFQGKKQKLKCLKQSHIFVRYDLFVEAQNGNLNWRNKNVDNTYLT